MQLVPRNWKKFQHYKNRLAPWVKLHKSLLDDRDFVCLPIASKALAPLLWLLASESEEGHFDGSVGELAFRLRWTEKDINAGLKPLIDKGFFIVDSTMLADCEQLAAPEERREERETEEKSLSKPIKSKTSIPEDFAISESVQAWALKNGHKQLDKHLERFIDTCKAKGYKYIDWDAAFRKAISDDWAKVNQSASPLTRIDPYQRLAEQERARLAGQS